MEVVTCYCTKCKEKLGRFNNCWNGIGSLYYSPADLSYTILGTLGMKATGDVKPAAVGTKIEKSYVQDLACANCDKLVGIRCDNAPPGHMLKRDQLILRLFKSITVISDSTGEAAKLNVLKTFSLTGPPPETARRAINGSMAALAQQEFTKFADWAEDAISTQRQDIDRIDGVVGRIERDLQTFKDFMGDVRKEMATLRREPKGSANQDLASIRKELNDLRLQVEANQHSGAGLSTHEYDALTQDMLKIDQKASEVGGLKMELNFLKTRLKRFEDSAGEGFDLGDSRRAETQVETATTGQRPSGGPSRRETKTNTTAVETRSLGGPSRAESALRLAKELSRDGQQQVAARIAARYTLGKRKADDPEAELPQLTSTAKKGRLADLTNRASTGPSAKTSSVNQMRYVSPPPQADSSELGTSPVMGDNGEDDDRYAQDELIENYRSASVKRPVGRPRKNLINYPDRRRDSDGILLTESGKVDGRSLRKKKSNVGGGESSTAPATEATGKSRRRVSAPMVISLDEDDAQDISNAAKRVFHKSARHGSVLPSIEMETKEEEAKRRKMEAREALIKETLERYA